MDNLVVSYNNSIISITEYINIINPPKYFVYFIHLPTEIKNVIISFTKTNIANLCLVNHHFSLVSKSLKLTTITKGQSNKMNQQHFKNINFITSLSIGGKQSINDNVVKMLTNLKSLKINSRITDSSVKFLTNLTFLDLNLNSSISDKT